jgi:hypothetical protein
MSRWFLIYQGALVLGIVFGETAAKAAMVKYPGAQCCGFKTYRGALRAWEKWPDYDGDEPPPLF